MKNRLFLVFAATLLVCPYAHALPTNNVPDSGSTLGLVVLGLLAFVFIRRKVSK